MLNEIQLNNYSNYFDCLVNDLDKTSRYAEPMGQETVFSFEYYKIISLSCAEVETVLKLICKTIDEEKNPRNIKEYAEILLAKYPKIVETEVSVSRIFDVIKPFEDWSVEKCTFWWDEHQDIKHSRHLHFQKATYKNALYSLAVLYVLLLYLSKINNIEFDSNNRYFYNVSVRQFLACAAPGNLPDFVE